MKKYEQIYFTVEGPNDKRLGWKIAGGIGFSLVAVILIVIIALHAGLVDIVGTALATKAFNYPRIFGYLIIVGVLFFIYKRVRK